MLDGLPAQPLGLAAVPSPAIALEPSALPNEYRPGFFGVFGFSSRVIELIRFRDEADANRGAGTGASPFDAFLERTGMATANVTGTAVTRSIAVDAGARRKCEAACASDVECLAACAAVPLDVYVASRLPDALLIGQTRPLHNQFATDDVPDLTDAEPIRGGPSRVVLGEVIDELGERATRVFVLAFDARFLYVYDPVARAVEARIQAGRGPHAFAVDGARGIGYIAHFTDSYVGVVDLDKRHRTYAQLILAVGAFSPPRSSQ